mmetsp:Transcript_11061/g.11161  ORF Transcript_11061/g.11161 Transcript_11061/m.11161 type:complete len:96 (-) Transcript_11061:475-762(-)
MGTCMLVAAPSYYMCSKTHIYKEKMISEMMDANEFLPQSEMPEAPDAAKDHPFLEAGANETNKKDETETKEFYTYIGEEKFVPKGVSAELKERKR